ncbi:phosphohydrolase [Shewanella sp. 10N.286.51.B7]|uniref:HD-GYP domain-containing protein n=1 Tax=Shewanella sp. 10N.286.51.B7 TaxID=1880836 RepID=UPI000C837EBF|nr:HD domain-containing phosphohydrolase [Shewanella sp. 10N.286.51.B7]PMG80299.1 phosphohydrolase [Shewanella sp. 10N.286.51.B7]
MSKTESINIPLSQLVVGLTVKLPLSWFNNPFFRNKVPVTSQAEIELINSLDITYVTVIDGMHLLANDEEIEDVVVEDAVPEFDIQGAIKKSVHSGQKRFNQAASDLRPAFSKVVSEPQLSYRESASVVEQLMTHLLESKQPELVFVTSVDKEPSLTQHSVSVAVLSMMMANSLGLSHSELRDLALGCVFHDIGKLKIPEAIRRKRKDLTTVEINYMKTHPNLGYEMLDRSGLFPAPMLDIVLHHHECLDGSGYPNKLNEVKIPKLTQIAALANDYAGLLLKTGSPQVALGTLFKTRVGKHGKDLIQVLVKVLGIYPPGSIVKLSDGSIAKVMMTSRDSKQPHVYSCNDRGGQAVFRCLTDEDVSVVETVKADSLSEKIVSTLQVQSPVCFYPSHIIE